MGAAIEAPAVAITWEKERLASLLEAAKSAVARSRYVFGAINVATIQVLSAEFNFLAPWIRNVIPRAPPDKVREWYQQFMDIDLRTVSVPIIGLRFSVADLSVVASVGMALLSLWLF